jgi:SAM-dependent methyltransferase
MLDATLLSILRCPSTGEPLHENEGRLVSSGGTCSYEVIEGIPCLIPPETISTHSGYDDLMDHNRQVREVDIDLDAYLNGMLVPTCGNLFQGLKLAGRYPIPDFPAHLPPGLTLDVGCNWGRWTIAGALAGRRMVGVDIHLEGLLVARQLARKLVPGNAPYFVLADARYLPFATESFDAVASYSVVQHFSRANAAVILGELGRVLRLGGSAAIQMPNWGGLKARLTMGRKRFADGAEFDVRYYAITDLLAMFQHKIGASRWSVDCFFGLNVHAKDKPLLLPSRRLLVDIAEAFRWMSSVLPNFGRLADSVWITAEKAAVR